MIYSSLEKFVSFLGPVRTGHTLIASLLSAHPNIAISIEINPLLRFKGGESREELFERIFEYCVGSEQRKKGGYSYRIRGLFQKSVDNVRVIGDSMTGFKYMNLINEGDTLDKFYEYIELPISWLLVLRDPFNLIQSSSMMNNLSIEENIDIFSDNMIMVKKILKDNRFLVIYLEKFIKRPSDELIRILDFLELPYTKNYLKTCSSFVERKPKKFRKGDWNKSQITKVLNIIEDNELLRFYR